MTRTIFVGRPTIYFDAIDSTNGYAIELVSNSNPNEGTVIWASHQTHGRGQIGSTWDAEAGKNLLMSVILQPHFLFASQQFVLNIITSLALCAALRELNIEAKIKWPNDIYIEDKKVCGILIQNILFGKKIKYAVVGIGLNVNQSHFDPNLPNPTSLSITTNTSFDITEIKALVCKQLQHYYHRIKVDGYEALAQEYKQNLYLLDTLSGYESADQKFNAVLKGIDATGKLLLEKSNGISSYNLRELKFLHKKV